MKMEHSVPKRRYIKFRRRGITRKKSIRYSEHGEKLEIKNNFILTTQHDFHHLLRDIRH